MDAPATLVVIGLVPLATVAVVAGYVCWLAYAPAPARRRHNARNKWPSIDFVIPVFNEARILRAKLENARALSYPRSRLRIVVVDGGSTDGSRQLAEEWAIRHRHAIVLGTARPWKGSQLNLALRHSAADWIVVSDADARMPPETLRMLMRAAAEHGVRVIGSPVCAVNTHTAEQMYWRILNWLREREWRRGSASMVMAPCYAFDRSLIEEIPADNVSDDVFVAWHAASLGLPVAIAGPCVDEIRETSGVSALFRQKVRRGSGVLRELFRFIPRLRAMRPNFGVVFLWRCTLFALALPLIASGVGATFLSIDAASDETNVRTLTAGVLFAAAGCFFVVGRRSLALGIIVPLAAAAALLIYPITRPRHTGVDEGALQGLIVSARRRKRPPAYSP